MARRLINEQGYSSENMQVLLGGWNTWRQLNGDDPAKYPIEASTNSEGTPFPSATAVPTTDEFPTFEPPPQLTPSP